MDREQAEGIAFRALAFLAADADRLGRFLAATGLGPDRLRAMAGEPEVLGGVLDYLLDHEALLVAFAEEAGLAPADAARARAALPGAAPPG